MRGFCFESSKVAPLNIPASARADAGQSADGIKRHADSRGANSTGLFVISLLKIGRGFYEGPRVGWVKAGERNKTLPLTARS